MKNFTVWDIFEKIETNNVLKNWLWDLPATTAVWSNNQIGKYIDRKWATILKDVFSATANWFWKVFFQPNEFTVLQDSYAFTLKKSVKNIKRLQMYFVSILNKIYSKYSWENKSWWNKIKEEIISLPTLSNWELAYEYMENYIKEIEAYHIKEIEAYLQSTGLSDYELTRDEMESLRIIAEGKGKKFTLDELFEKKTMKWYPKSAENLIENKDWYHIFWQNIKYQYPQKVLLDESYLHKINKDEPILAYTSSVWEIWMIYENFYRSWDNWAFQWLYPKFSGYNRKHILFILACLNKKFKQFNYWTWMSKIMDLEIILPITSDNEINLSLIESYITATQKLVIKDLVDNINEKLKTYKQVI